MIIPGEIYNEQIKGVCRDIKQNYLIRYKG